MTLMQGNDLDGYDYGSPKSATYPLAAEQRAAAAQLRQEHDQTRRDQ